MSSVLVSSERDRPAGLDVDVEGNRLVDPGFPDLDLVRPRLEVQVLEHTVEVVHDADVVAVSKHLRELRMRR